MRCFRSGRITIPKIILTAHVSNIPSMEEAGQHWVYPVIRMDTIGTQEIISKQATDRHGAGIQMDGYNHPTRLFH